MKKEKKHRYYDMKYWVGFNLIETENWYKSLNDAHKYCNRLDYKILSIKYIGWK